MIGHSLARKLAVRSEVRNQRHQTLKILEPQASALRILSDIGHDLNPNDDCQSDMKCKGHRSRVPFMPPGSPQSQQ